VIVATNPLSVSGWERFLPGELKVLKQGNIAFADRVALHEPVNTTSPPLKETPSALTSESTGTR